MIVATTVLVALAAAHLATTAVARWERGATLARPAHPVCRPTPSHALGPGAVVPVVSWALHRGRCRTCGQPVGWDLLAVEVGAIVVVAAAMWRHPWPDALVAVPLAWSAVVATPIDLRRRIIPNRMTYPLIAWTLAVTTLLAATSGTWSDWRRAMIVGALVAGLLLVVSLAFEFVRGSPGMGMGDIKWSLALGVGMGWLGLGQAMGWMIGTVVSNGIVIVILLATRRARLAERIPYGPYLAAGTLWALFGVAPVP